MKKILSLILTVAMLATMFSINAFAIEAGERVTDILIEAETDFTAFGDYTPESLDTARVALSDEYPYLEAINYPGAPGKSVWSEVYAEYIEWFEYNVNVPVSGFYRILLEIRECSRNAKVTVNNKHTKTIDVVLTTAQTNWKNNPLPYTDAGLFYLKEGNNTVKFEPVGGTLSYGSFRVVSPDIDVYKTANQGTVSLTVDALNKVSGNSASTDGDFFATDRRDDIGAIQMNTPVADPNYGNWIKWTFDAPVEGDYTFNLAGWAAENKLPETEEYFTTADVPGCDGAFKAHIEIDGEDKASVGSAGNYVSNLGTFHLAKGEHTIKFENDSFAYYYVNGMDITYVEKNEMYFAVKGATKNTIKGVSEEITADSLTIDVASVDPNYGTWITWNVDLPIDGSYTFTLDHGGYVNTDAQNQTIEGVLYPGAAYVAHLEIDGVDTPIVNNGDVKNMCMGTFELTAGPHTIVFKKDCYARMAMNGINVDIAEPEALVYELEEGKTYKAAVDLTDYYAGVTNLNDAETGTTDADIPWTADEFSKVSVIAAVYDGGVLYNTYVGNTIEDNKIEVTGIKINNGQTVKLFIWDMANLRALTDFVVY